jgi:hypothetical protein
VIKSRRIRWTGHVAHTGDRRTAYRVLVRRPEGQRPIGRPRRRWRIILKRIFNKRDGETWTGLIWLRIRKSGGRL